MRAIERTEDRVERVYRDEAPRLWRALLAYAQDRAIADDAVAEAFAQAIGRGEAIRDVAAWVWRSAFRIAAGELAVRARNDGRAIEPVDQVGEPAFELVGALAELSPKQRGAIVLHHYAGYPVKEVAEMLGSTAAAVKVHLSVGRRRLRALLEGAND